MAIDGLPFGDAVNVLGARLGIAGRQWTSTDRSRYAHAAREAPALAQRLADFTRGLELATERPLKRVSDAIERVGIDPSETLAHLDQVCYLLAQVTPRDIAATFGGMPLSDPEAVHKIESLGRSDRENAEIITSLIVDVLAASQRAEVAS
jgi:hypothetical protein